jgi:hypothetical protein
LGGTEAGGARIRESSLEPYQQSETNITIRFESPIPPKYVTFAGEIFCEYNGAGLKRRVSPSLTTISTSAGRLTTNCRRGAFAPVNEVFVTGGYAKNAPLAAIIIRDRRVS